MIVVYRKKSRVAILLAVGEFVLGFLLLMAGAGNRNLDPLGVVAMMSLLSGGVLWCYGCWMYAKAKGYSGVVGLLGLLGLIGLLILLLLRDQHKEGSAVPNQERAA